MTHLSLFNMVLEWIIFPITSWAWNKWLGLRKNVLCKLWLGSRKKCVTPCLRIDNQLSMCDGSWAWNEWQWLSLRKDVLTPMNDLRILVWLSKKCVNCVYELTINFRCGDLELGLHVRGRIGKWRSHIKKMTKENITYKWVSYSQLHQDIFDKTQ